jgi:hypothetical protein
LPHCAGTVALRPFQRVARRNSVILRNPGHWRVKIHIPVSHVPSLHNYLPPIYLCIPGPCSRSVCTSVICSSSLPVRQCCCSLCVSLLCPLLELSVSTTHSSWLLLLPGDLSVATVYYGADCTRRWSFRATEGPRQNFLGWWERGRFRWVAVGELI